MTTTEMSLLIEGRAAAASGRGIRLREAAGLSQVELAAAVGVTPPALGRWENRTRTPRGETAIAYAKALRRVANEVAEHA